MTKTIQANIFFGNESKTNDTIIVGENISNPENIGAFLRLAGNFGVEKVYIICDELPNQRKIMRTASTAKNIVKLIQSDISILETLASEGYDIVAVETGENAINIRDFEFSRKTVLLLGNESYGLSEDALKYSSAMIFIPMFGAVKSMNVSQALTIALYECVL